METFDKIWAMIMPYFTVGTMTTIIMAIMTGLIKGGIGKKFSEVNMGKLFEKAFNKVIEHFQSTTLKTDIQPLVEERLKDIEKNAIAMVKGELATQKQTNLLLFQMLGQFMGYFNNSVGIPEEQRAKAKETYETAMALFNDKPAEPVATAIAPKEEKREESTITIER